MNAAFKYRFSNELPWLVLMSFQIGHAIQVSKLGERISLNILKLVGSNALSLGYGIYISELVLGAFIPSNTARGGGLILPLVHQILLEFDEEGVDDSLNGFIVMCASSANLVSSSFFMTGTIGNPLITAIAKESFGIDFGFFTWLVG
jgi:DASS family divalent anion:Na+ symporter